MTGYTNRNASTNEYDNGNRIYARHLSIATKADSNDNIAFLQDGLPEPDIMEFFDPNKHIFKSVNLSLGSNSINLKPKLSLANGRLYSIFRDRDLLNQFQ